MSMILGGGVVAVIALGYAGRKGWLAFHRAVGITPGRMTYTEPQSLPPPELIQLQLSSKQQQSLPQPIAQQLRRIDSKANMLQSNKDKMMQLGHTPTICEDDFIIQKLLSERLPDMLDSYQQVHAHEQQMAQVHAQSHSQQYEPSQNWHDAVRLLTQLLTQIEGKLDAQLASQQNNALQDMQVMERYLEDR